MADSYYWQSGNILTPVGMTSTTRFNDGSSGDTTTGETVTSAAVTNASNQFTAMIVFDAPVSLTSFTVTYGSLLPSGGGGILSHTNNISIEYYDGSWHVLKTNSNNVLGVAGPPYPDFLTYTDSISGTATRLRAYLTGSTTTLGPTILGTGISDFRASYAGGCTPPAPPTLNAQGVLIDVNYLTGLGGYPVIILTN